MTDYTAKLFLQAHAALPDILVGATSLDFAEAPHLTCRDLVAGPIADALTKAGADCCLEDQLGLAVMMLAELARRYTDLRSRLEDVDVEAAVPTDGHAAGCVAGRECEPYCDSHPTRIAPKTFRIEP